VDLLLDAEEQSVASLAREVLDNLATPGLARETETNPLGYSADLWREIARLDWIGLCLPGAIGGQDLPLHYAGLLLGEVGRHIAPIPLHSTLTAALTIARHGRAGQVEALLPGVISGESVMTVAFQEGRTARSRNGLRTVAVRDGGEYVITGVKHFVDNFAAADSCVVSCADGQGVGLFVVPAVAPGISSTPLVTLAKDRQSNVAFDHVRVPASALLGEPGEGRSAAEAMIDLGTALLCAQLAGATRRDAEFAVDYSRNRVAFGRPIGAFQSIQHLAADMLIAVDGVDLLTREALWRLGAGLTGAIEVSQAKAFASEKCVFVARSSQQVHGGIGFMMEFDLHLWYRRVVAWSMRYGTAAEHRARIAAALLDTPGPVRLGMDQVLPS
jgi:alkylation response protein AidB-like acyl-CoA dehydrogenase